MYKMAEISEETWQKNGMEVIVFNGKKWLNETNVKDQLKHSNLAAVTLQYPLKYKKQRQELQNCGNYQPCRIFLKESLAIQIIMDCRSTPAVDFKTRLGFSHHDPIMTQEQSILSKIVTLFSAEQIILQHNVLSYRIDAYFPKHKLAIEVDEQGHNDRDIDYEIRRQKAIEKELGCKFIRINPVKEGFNIFAEIGKIQNYIIKSTKKITKKSTINDAKELLKGASKFKNNNIISKFTRNFVKHLLPKS